MNVLKSSILSLFPLFIFLDCAFCSTSVDKCENGGELPGEVDVVNCTQQPCDFYIGTNTTMTMKFNSPRYLEKIAPKAVAYLGTLAVPYPLGQEDACDGITNTPCPIAEQEYVEYSFSMYISPIFPTIGVRLEFSLIDLEQNQENVECFSMNIQVKKLP